MNNGMHNQNQEARPGYKWTKLGWVPVEWEVVKLKEVAAIGNGTTPSRKDTKYWEKGDIPWLPTGKVNEKVIRSADEFITKKALEGTSLRLLPVNTVLVAMIGQGKTRGMSAIIKIEATVNQNFAYIIAKSDLNPMYLFSKMTFDYAKIRGSGRGGGQESLNCRIIKNYTIPIPPLPEQQKIATILSTWDRAIALTRQLITAKEEQKKGLMQRLLTGKVRVAGFEGEWEEVKFGDVFKFVNSYALSRKDLKEKGGDTDIYNIHYGDIHAKFRSEFIDFEKEDVPVASCLIEVKSEEHFLRNGDIIMADASEDYKGIGDCKEIKNLENKKALGGLHTFVVRDRFSRTADAFRVYCLKNPLFRNEVRRLATGSSVYGISKSNLSKVFIFIPSIQEQTAIANILTKADEEIDLLKAELAALQEQKQGLMQQLLTGQIRVRV